MSKNQPDHRSPTDRVADFASMLEAMRQGVQDALLRHKREGNPIAVWRDGAVAWIPPEEIDIDDAASGER